jgi:lipopolysaccharide heptosyltransferase II
MLRQNRLPEWSTYKNILCIRPDNLGDLLMTTPALRALKESVSGRKITLLTSKQTQKITPFIPEVDEVINFSAPWVRPTNSSSEISSLKGIAEELKSRQFDAAIIFTTFSQSALPAAFLCQLAGIVHVLAYNRENPYQLIDHWVPDYEPIDFIQHEVERQLNLVKHIQAQTLNKRLSLQIPELHPYVLEEKLTSQRVKLDQPWLVLHVGAAEPRRRYPVELFAEVGRKLIKDLEFQVLLTGGEDEQVLGDTIQECIGQRSFNLAGKLSLPEFINLIHLAPGVITNNTSTSHIAAAVNTPVVVLYAQTNPQHTPWMVNSRVLYFGVPEHLRSKSVIEEQAFKMAFAPIPMLQPTEVIEAVEDLLSTKESTLENPNSQIIKEPHSEFQAYSGLHISI